ncbi:MAG: acetyl esterase/lipase [Gammaproteobacteria bacterium]|jgi:acetyl esterase/lipase
MPSSFVPLISILLTFTVTLSGCFSYQGKNGLNAPPQESRPLAQTVRDIAYTPPHWPEVLRSDLYLPQQQGGLHPVVLMVHGGGWSGRSRADMNGISEKLAHQGYAVFNISYRFAPEYTFPAQYHDLQQAMRWLTEYAEVYQLDTSRINAWGYSSGAHLAALLASVDAGTQIANNQGETLPRIRAVVAGGTPTDLRKYSGSPIIVPFLGGDRDEIPQRYAQASPVFHISADDPPVFLYHGKLDTLVEKEQASDYFEALQAAGVESELYLYRFWGHFTMFVFGGDAEDKAIDFLNRKNV